ncbi:hypothetical protein [Streptomyces sp. NRRL B-24484]|uniref:hypothetical protein n=1 Tax=Streptomyces sp. NRRL B-24484 TaxID=1463833 RepID=UPI0004C023BE|nr:hypothetical protein [Streptomyces sp. NRRL B-24484]
MTAGSPNLISQYRAEVDEMVTRLKGYDRPVHLRIGYEFDGPWNCCGADFYKQAFACVKGRIDALGAANVATVWQSAAWPLNTDTDHPEWNHVVTDPTNSPTPAPTPTGSQAPYTQGVAAGSSPVVWFRPNGFTASFVTVHLTVNGGAQGNYFLSRNAAQGRWEQPVSVRSGDRVSHWFDYQPTTQTYQVSTPVFTATV